MPNEANQSDGLPFAGSAVGREVSTMRMLAKLLGRFSDPTRLAVLLILTRQGETRVKSLVEQLGTPQPRISEHLRLLYCCGLVKVRHEGRGAYYSIADERVMQMIGLCQSLLQDNLGRIEGCNATGTD